MVTADEVTSWTIIKTHNYDVIVDTLKDAYEYSLLYGLIGFSGAGKSTALRSYKSFLRGHKNVIYFRLDDTYTKKDLYVELLREFDPHEYGYDIPVRFLAKRLAKLINAVSGKVLIIIDDAGRFNADKMQYFQSIFDANEGKLGMILSGTSKFREDFKSWVDLQKKGISELDTRFHDWVILSRPLPDELKAVAAANGVKADLDNFIKGCNNFRTLRSRVIDQRKKKIKK